MAINRWVLHTWWLQFHVLACSLIELFTDSRHGQHHCQWTWPFTSSQSYLKCTYTQDRCVRGFMGYSDGSLMAFYVQLTTLFLFFWRSWRSSLPNRKSCFSPLLAGERRFWSCRPHPAVPGSCKHLGSNSALKNRTLMAVSCVCSASEPFTPQAVSEAGREQMRQRWESLRLELKTKLQLLQKTLEQDQSQQVPWGFLRMAFLQLLEHIRTLSLLFRCLPELLELLQPGRCLKGTPKTTNPLWRLFMTTSDRQLKIWPLRFFTFLFSPFVSIFRITKQTIYKT